MEYAEWKNFRKALPKTDRKVFDDMISLSVFIQFCMRVLR
jgi:hypothetical protein